MIELPYFKDEDWYLNNIKKILVHGNTSQKNFDDKYKECVEPINQVLESLLDKTVFSNYQGRSMLEELILAPFCDLKKIFMSIEGQWNELFYFVDTDEKVKRKEHWQKLYLTYDKFVRNNLNVELVEKYNIKCCPYCNENFIFNRDTYTMAQLDHFYPRDKYPIFSVCLYNLVPACGTCNHIKRDKMIGVSPHEHSYSYSHMRISYVPKSSNWIDDYNEIEVKFLCDDEDKDFSEKIKINLKEMEIEKSYHSHRDYVQEILKKAHIYNTETRSNLCSDFPELFHSDEEVVRVIFGNYIGGEEMLKRPLSKLTRDILKELHIIK